MFKRLRGQTAVAIALGAAAAVAVLSVDGVAATRRADAFPAQLVGIWTRTLTKADIQRANVVPGEVEHAFPGLVVVLVVKKNGAAEVKLVGQSGPIRWQGRLVPLGADRVRITIPLDVPNAYRWHVSGRQLTLTKISESEITGLRTAWFTGVWKRKG